jgi:hypothetical protein
MSNPGIPQPPPGGQQWQQGPPPGHGGPPPGYGGPPPGYGGPPPGYGGPPPGYGGPPPPPKKSGKGLFLGLIAVTVTALVVVGALAGTGTVCLPFYCKTDSSSVLATDEIPEGLDEVMVEGADSVTVGSYESGRVTSDSGVSITIPQRAVPLMEDGSAGEMVFGAITVDMEVNLPPEHSAIGSVYQLQPEGFRFDQPVSVSFPIPDDVDPADVQGAAYYDAANDGWVMNPTAIDAEARTATIQTTHFSYWTLWRTSSQQYVNLEVSRPSNQPYQYETERRGLPTITTYGVCLQPLSDDPAWNGMQDPSSGWIDILSSTKISTPGTSQVRPGAYRVVQYFAQSEVNHDPLYVPRYWVRWNNLGEYTWSAGEAETFDPPSIENTTSWTEGRPPCWGGQDTSAGTGDIQVTLTWQAHIDLDLWVTDPDGETVYWANDLTASGGSLDRDNRCANMEVGRSENIFWSAGDALPGEYVVEVDYWGECDQDGPVDWSVGVFIQSEGTWRTYTGTISEGETQEVTRFTIG